MKNVYVEVTFSQYLDTVGMADGEVVYFGGTEGNEDIYEVMDLALDLLDMDYRQALDMFNAGGLISVAFIEEQVISYVTKEELDEYVLDETDLYDLPNLIDVLGEIELYEAILEFYGLDELLGSLGLYYGRAGYSPWTRYMALNDNPDYYNDLYTGDNFFDIVIYDDDGVVDSLGEVYLTNFKDLDGVLIQNFNIRPDDNHIYLIENDLTTYFKDQFNNQTKEKVAVTSYYFD